MRATDDRSRSIAVQQRERRPAARWMEDFDTFFDRAWREFGLRRWPFVRALRPPAELWEPEVDIFKRNGKLVVRADLPGVKHEDVGVAIEGNALVISGRRQEEREVKEEDYYRCERAVGEFSRALGIPEGVDAKAVEAKFKDGILEVTLPLPATAEARKVTVPIK